MPLEENAKVVLGQTQVDDNSPTDEFAGESELESTLDKNENASIPTRTEETSDDNVDSEACTDAAQNDEVCEIAKMKCEEDIGADTHKIEALAMKINDCTVAQKDLETKVIQTLKENVNFQIQVRQNMQKELEDAKKKLSGDIFVPLLKEIAELYVEWSDVIDELEGVPKRKVAGIFEVLEEILEENGCVLGTSEIDSKRRTKYSKLKNKVPTSDKAKHETIAKSYNPWIVKEPFVLYPEYVDVYVFDPNYIDNLKDGRNEQDEQSEETEYNEPIKED